MDLPRLIKRESINHRKGFTLVELLVVISIIAILAVVGITLFTNVQKSARDARRRADLKAIALALEQYKSVTGLYPTTLSTDPIYINSTVGGTWIPNLGSNYIIQVPVDPINSSSYNYDYASGSHTYMTGGQNMAGKFFVLKATLENPNDRDKATGCISPTGYRFCNGCGAGDTYGSNNKFFVCSQQ